MNLKKIEKIFEKEKIPKYRIEQIRKAILKDGVSSFLEISTLPKDVREELDREVGILSFHPEIILKSLDQRSIKAKIRLADGKYVETVFLSPKPDVWSACVSSQVGCPMGCPFCATGKGGFGRNLTAEEISDQVLFWKQYHRKNRLKGIFSNIVFMGMGEPFLNWKEVEKALDDLISPSLFGFGSRSISISTVGVPKGIGIMAKKFPQVNLALSLHFSDEKKRSKYIPINKAYGLDSLKKALVAYLERTRRKVFLEYVMLEGINDSKEDADNLIRFIRSFKKGYLLHVNLISYNETGSQFSPTRGVDIKKFGDYLSSKKIGVTIRKSLGDDIQGACGQLAG